MRVCAYLQLLLATAMQELYYHVMHSYKSIEAFHYIVIMALHFAIIFTIFPLHLQADLQVQLVT